MQTPTHKHPVRDTHTHSIRHRQTHMPTSCWPTVPLSSAVIVMHDRNAIAAIAQLKERQIEDLKVPGSIPGLSICLIICVCDGAFSRHCSAAQSRTHTGTLAHQESESREIRSPNVLIWSQTRYRCAIPPITISMRIASHFFVSTMRVVGSRDFPLWCNNNAGGRKGDGEADGGWVWQHVHGRRIVTGGARRQRPQDQEQSNPFAIIGVILLGQALGAKRNVHTRTRTWVVAATTRRPNH